MFIILVPLLLSVLTEEKKKEIILNFLTKEIILNFQSLKYNSPIKLIFKNNDFSFSNKNF